MKGTTPAGENEPEVWSCRRKQQGKLLYEGNEGVHAMKQQNL
jgi:hypothetical protein